MIKYYTRACNFKYGITAKKLIKKKSALALCGNKSISFSEVEIITRNRKKITSNIKNDRWKFIWISATPDASSIVAILPCKRATASAAMRDYRAAAISPDAIAAAVAFAIAQPADVDVNEMVIRPARQR